MFALYFPFAQIIFIVSGMFLNGIDFRLSGMLLIAT